MKVLVILLLLVPLLSCRAVALDPFHPLDPRVIDCDDPESEEAAAIALNYINAHHPHGYKYALNIIEKIKVLPRRPSGEIFELELDLLETVCHIVNPLPAENCTVRPRTDHVVEGDCEVKLLKLEGTFSVLSIKCLSTPDSVEDITQICPDCPVLALLNDTQVINAVDLALTEYNGRPDGAYVKLLEIGRAQIQHFPDIVSVEFAVVVTNCSAKDAQDHVDDCQLLPMDLAQFGFCNAAVLTKNNITVSCTIYEHQLLCSWAVSPPVTEPPSLLLSPACNDSAIEAAADLALRQINANQREGYVLGLYRIFSIQEHPQKITGSVFYLTLDVVETECHVLSRRLWKDCKNRAIHETRVFVIFYKVPSSSFLRICPDCPVPGCPTEPKYLETAAVSLAKFNKESEQAHHFSVLNVTKASMQWVVGPSHFVEFTIQETSCSKNESIADVSKCKPLPSELAHTGLCKGSVINSQIDHHQFVSISCEIYNPQHPHNHEHKQEHRREHQHPSHSEDSHFSPHLEKTVGWVKVLPAKEETVSLHTLPENQSEHIDGQPVPPEKAKPVPALPDTHSVADVTGSSEGKPGLTKPATGPAILPFPEGPLQSDVCPGEPKFVNPIILPLLPRNPIKIAVSPRQTVTE
ncbi:Alpha-2-HS-glycoprotein [Chelonia mydas]|uniref:Alpha-2-HS-glycoprotein n=1 Tax=Chelonia mydas TaxID=8469 RepID=M7AWR6_CHEMY|nr:Alpha-2-HS-glycoprotein [Chelonia mydas]